MVGLARPSLTAPRSRRIAFVRPLTAWPPSGPFRQRHGEGKGHETAVVSSDVLNDLIISILVAIAAVLTSGLLDRVWDAL
jgi:hypothetical protein